MKEDLNKAEQRWAQRRLFSSPPPRRWRWLWLVLLAALLLLFYRVADGQLAGVLGLSSL